MTVYTCEDSLEGILTCIYDAWSSGKGHKNIRLMLEPVTQPELFCTYCHTDPDSEKSARVIRSIKEKISPDAWKMIYRAAMACEPKKADRIYRFLLYGFAYGGRSLHMLQAPPVMALFELNRRVANEAHRHLEFLRFIEFPGSVLVGHISPRSDILALTAPYFSDRMPSENWIIVDDTRETAAVHPRDETFYLTHLSCDELEYLSAPEQRDDPFPSLWKGFFRSVSIPERENYRCQQSFLPLWMRRHMTEFH